MSQNLVHHEEKVGILSTVKIVPEKLRLGQEAMPCAIKGWGRQFMTQSMALYGTGDTHE